MIIGINTSHDATFTLVDQKGCVAFILEEERFNRQKHSGFSTHLSLNYLLNKSLLNPAEVTDLVFNFEMEDDIINLLMERCYQNVARDFGSKVLRQVKAYSNHPFSCSPTMGFGTTTDMYTEIDHLKRLFPNALLSSYNHHLCHAASAYYPSGFESAAVLIADGSGRLETTSIWHAQANEIRLLKQIELPHSLGILYWLFSSFINLEEGKTMGLASYGRPLYKELIYREILGVEPNGDFRFKIPLVFWFDMDSEYAMIQIEHIFGVKRRFFQSSPLNQFHADVAASVQTVLEETIEKLAIQAMELTGEKNLCLAGGVFQNCVANGKLAERKIFKRIWIQPMANDSGAALGAGLVHFYQKNRHLQKRWKMRHPYHGIGYSQSEIAPLIRRIGASIEYQDHPSTFAANQISKGCIAGRFFGRSEVGPRALGNRSILSDARFRLNHFSVNHIKNREPWRPLAPSVLNKKMASVFTTTHPSSPWMILSFEVRKNWLTQIPAVVHIDGTARPQTVNHFNGPFLSLLSEYARQTNIPLISNTSFNLQGEPIVQHPLDAIRDAILSKIDLLLINDQPVTLPPIASPLLDALRKNRFCSLYYEYFHHKQTVYILDSNTRENDDVRTILTWLGIRWENASLNNLIRLLRENPNLDLILDNPYELRSWLAENQAIPELYPGMHIFVLEKSGFMAKNGIADFNRLLIKQFDHMSNLFGNKKILVFASQSDSETISTQMLACGFDVATRVHHPKDLKRSNPNPDHTFLVVSREYMDTFNAAIRDLGYQFGRGYLLWEF